MGNKGFNEFLANLDEETFELNKKSVINNLLEKPKSIYEQNNKYWREIGRRRYQYEREQNVTKQIELLKKEDLTQFYELFICQKGERTKLTVQCFGNQHDLELKDVKDDDMESKSVDIIQIRTRTVQNYKKLNYHVKTIGIPSSSY